MFEVKEMTEKMAEVASRLAGVWDLFNFPGGESLSRTESKFFAIRYCR